MVAMAGLINAEQLFAGPLCAGRLRISNRAFSVRLSVRLTCGGVHS